MVTWVRRRVKLTKQTRTQNTRGLFLPKALNLLWKTRKTVNVLRHGNSVRSVTQVLRIGQFIHHSGAPVDMTA